ncbi:hypothetical protein TL16_g05790 [Triparma laevis f. inornata]|uniref:Uncharacterized protein n=1 Tax=Triparma laevis f. inornata TaxID=1714386 RepID=A0A9W7E859_9STRA|nr:hypothetical protein TL16_g05790 [Triparma laevis f. inornata]
MSQFSTSGAEKSSHASIGLQGMWGFSPASNLLSEASFQAKDGEPIDILIMNSCDIRHVLKTASQRRRSAPNSPLNFYLIDTPTEVLARHFLLLQVLTDWEIPIRQRSILFLEIYGNSMIQDRTARYIEETARGLIELITDGDHPLADVFNLSNLKFRDRDLIENSFKSWFCSEPFDMQGLRDQRLRHYYGDRYDVRKNVLDWDYQTRIKEVASIIHIKQYREWRNSGIAFEFGDATYNSPNRSMASYTAGMMKAGKDKGMKKEIRGFWLDIICSPYAAFGVACEKVNKFAEDMFFILNEGTGTAQHRHHTVEVASLNVMSYLWEIETGETYTMRKKNDIFSGLGEDASDIVIYNTEDGDKPVEEEGGEELGEEAKLKAAEAKKKKEAEAEVAKQERLEKKRLRQAASRARNIVDMLDNIKIIPISGGAPGLYGKQKFSKKFDIAYLSQHGVHHCGDADFPGIMKDKGKVVLETGRHVYALQKKQCEELNRKMFELTEKQGWKMANGNPKNQAGLEDLENFVFEV